MAKLLSFILDDGEIVDILVNEEGAEYLINVLQNRIDYGKNMITCLLQNGGEMS